MEPKVVNSAMMRVSSFHKSVGDDVESYSALFHDSYDKIYAFSIFDFTDKSMVRSDMICGGTGFKDLICKRLPRKIEKCDYDWSLYPDCDYSLVWFSTGCVNDCKFCLVRKKEGFLKAVTPKNLNPNGKYVKVCDNNFFANPKWREAIQQLKDWGQPVDFQSIDVRTLNPERCKALMSLKHEKRIKIAWDDPKFDMVPVLKKVLKHISGWRFMCYVLIGFNSTPEEDLMRLEELRNLKIDPFVMPYNKSDPYQSRLARWCNNKAVFRTTSWEDYDHSLRGPVKPGYTLISARTNPDNTKVLSKFF